jgi:DNA-directed RNA polymerase omega subunit
LAVAHAADGLENKFRLVILSFQRARQLQNGARPRVESGGHKPARIAMLEVLAGLISWSTDGESDEQTRRT